MLWWGDLFFKNSLFLEARQRTDKFISSRGSDRRGDAKLGPSSALLKAQVFKLHIALTGLSLFALHVKLDQHLLNLNGKRVQRIILLHLCYTFIIIKAGVTRTNIYEIRLFFSILKSNIIKQNSEHLL